MGEGTNKFPVRNLFKCPHLDACNFGFVKPDRETAVSLLPTFCGFCKAAASQQWENTKEFLVHWHKSCSLLKNQVTVGVEAMWKTETFGGVLKLVGRERPWYPAYFYSVCFLAWPSLSILAFPHPHSGVCKPSHLPAPDSLPVCLTLHHFCRLYLCIWVVKCFLEICWGISCSSFWW